jgi:hypothetical protein
MDYVIIGDVHGMFEPLEILLKKVGFTKKNDVYQHPKYIAVFAGDIVDRGKHQRAVIELVRAMVDYGSAKVVLGNHEYNVIDSYRINPETQQPSLVHNSYQKNQRSAILKDYPIDGDDTADMIDWLKSLPFYLDLGELRVVHATWDDKAIEKLAKYTRKEGKISVDDWQQVLTQGSILQRLVEPLLRGVTIRRPDHLKDTHKSWRRKYRVRWWSNDWSNWEGILCSSTDAKLFASVALPSQSSLFKPHCEQQKAIFFGHYWFKGTPKPLKRNLACLDYSACIGGYLTAYIWNHSDKPNEHGLREDRFISIPSTHYKEG